ncbi:MAG: L-serine ammonia-lyase, iron-sulfur-dependent, subunit alpha, partial [Angelakisella sp.]
MNKLTELIRDDMRPALGVTEPGAICFAVSKAKSYTKGAVTGVKLELNSGMYKNAFTCGIPNSNEVGNTFSAALGIVAGKPDKGLLSLEGVTEQDNVEAQKLIDAGLIDVQLSGISSDIFIRATVKTATDCCELTIKHAHTNVCKIVVNDNVILEQEEAPVTAATVPEVPEIHKYTLEQLYHYITTVPLEEISFIRDAYTVNMDLFETGLASTRTTFAKQLWKLNDNMVISKDAHKTAQLLCNAAIEARVIGLDKPAMSITGSGAHGIICTLPLYALYKTENLREEVLLRATALSYLVTMYIKEYSGKLSAFCGCAIAAGTGMACALLYMRGGSLKQMSYAINNMASSITGMICDGGNQGCTMKGIVAVDAAYRSVEMALADTYIFNEHGINGKTPEDTMHHMGLIASPGMVATEKTIV